MPLIHETLSRLTVTLADADYLVQEVLHVIVRELTRFRHNQQPGAFRAWLRTITIHRLRNYWRGRQTGIRAGTGGEVWKTLDQMEDLISDSSRAWEAEHDRHVTRRLMKQSVPDFEPTSW